MYKIEDRKARRGILIMTLRTVLVYAVLLILAFLSCFFIYLLFAQSTKSHRSLSTMNDLRKICGMGGSFFKNWKTAANDANIPIFRALGNSLFVSFTSSVLCVYFSTMVAYGIHMYRFKLRNFAYTFILVVMMVPGQVTSLGFIRLMYSWHLFDSFIPLIIPSIAAPVTFFFIKQYLESVLPFEMIEAARVDGSNEFRSFHQIVLPVVKPAIAVQFIFTFVTSWNNLYLPSLVLSSTTKKTLPILVAALRSATDGKKDEGAIYMCIFVAIIPLIIMYLCLSKFIIRGLTLGSVKG